MAEEICSTLAKIRWRATDSDWTIAALQDKTVIVGNVTDGKLLEGMEYRFSGKWVEHEKYGRQFQFESFAQLEPHSRLGVVAYLQKHTSGIGPVIANRLWQAFGSDAVATLRTDPQRCVDEVSLLHIEVAVSASEALREIARHEETKIDLMDLLTGRSFPHVLYDELIARWGVGAATIIRRNPFRMMLERFVGCGFVRCDRLYLDLGYRPDRLKRQALCLWHFIEHDSNGHTWFSELDCVRVLLENVGQLSRPTQAIRLAVRVGLMTKRGDWLTTRRRAVDEGSVAEKLLLLIVE